MYLDKISVPRFKMEYEADIIPLLEELGIRDLFQFGN